MMEEKIKHYFDRGIKKGFNLGYLKQQLKQHGHDAHLINSVANEYRKQHEPVKRIEVVKKESSSKPLIWALSFVIVVLFVYLIVHASKAPQMCDAEIKTVPVEVCSGSMNKIEAQEKLDELSGLTIDINQKQAQIDNQLDTINYLNSTVEDKEKVIEEQVAQLKEVSSQMKEERSRIKQLLVQLLKSIIEG
jgi:uncharacterized protein YoxC